MANPQLMTGIGAALAVFLSTIGASVASVQAGLFVTRSSHCGIKDFFPIMISGVLGIYGIIIAVILCGRFNNTELNEIDGYKYFSSGMTVGLACMASGLGMSRFIDSYMLGSIVGRSPPPSRTGQEEALITPTRLFSGNLEPTWKFLAVLVFLEALGLYGLIVALILTGK